MSLTRFDKPTSSKKIGFYQNLEDKTIGIGLSKWVQKASKDNKEKVFLALGTKKKNSDFDKSINIFEVKKETKTKEQKTTLSKIPAISIDPFIGHINVQFLEYYDNVLH